MKQEQKKNNVNLIVTMISNERRRDVTRKEGRRDVTTVEITEERRRDVTMKEGGRQRDGMTISTSPTNLDGQLKTVATANEIASSSIEKRVGDDDKVVFLFKTFTSFTFYFIKVKLIFMVTTC
ncbi:unnamed protein product [Brassica rapa subsp. narinosa]|uniref:(rape) hypothetical protein n=1 Tax=Brassica napus TaxID=3708 RepID=A0A816P423_BRANA|nr:unnamed protein product [Brassica napus]